jgi:hypothetical protein
MKRGARFVGADETPMPRFVVHALGIVRRKREFETKPVRIVL